MIVDPKGAILKQGIKGKDEALSVSLSYNNLMEFRNKFNVGPDWDKFTIH